MRGHDIGRGLSFVERFFRGTAEEEEFGRAMGAPMGELRHLINRGQARGFRRVKHLVKATTGLKWKMFEREVECRTTEHWVHFRSSLYGYHAWHGEPIRPSWITRGF